jgi:hypothetical protein
MAPVVRDAITAENAGPGRTEVLEHFAIKTIGISVVALAAALWRSVAFAQSATGDFALKDRLDAIAPLIHDFLDRNIALH